MAKDALAVYDLNPLYVERFINYANQKKNRNYDIAGFTDLNILEAYLQNNKIKAVLFSRDGNETGGFGKVKDILTNSPDKGRLIVICPGEQMQAIRNESNLECIEKYQSMEKILSQVENCLADDIRERVRQDRSLSVTLAGLYSPADKNSHPAQAAAVMRQMKRADGTRKHRALYLNLEPFSGMDALLDYPHDTSLSDVIYYYRTNPSRLAQALHEAKGLYQGMDVLTAPEDPGDLEELSAGGWPDFLAMLAGAGDYQYILIDLSVFQPELLELVLQNGNLYIPAMPSDPVSGGEGRPGRAQAATEQFRQYLADRGMLSLPGSILEVKSDAGGRAEKTPGEPDRPVPGYQ